MWKDKVLTLKIPNNPQLLSVQIGLSVNFCWGLIITPKICVSETFFGPTLKMYSFLALRHRRAV